LDWGQHLERWGRHLVQHDDPRVLVGYFCCRSRVSAKGACFFGRPGVRFDATGNLYISGLAAGFNFTPSEVPDNFVYVAKYNCTPGTPGGTSTPNSAAKPPDFTYAFTTIVERGAISLQLPSTANTGFAGQLEEKPWLAVDPNPTSPCYGNVYVAHTKVTRGAACGLFAVQRSRSNIFAIRTALSRWPRRDKKYDKRQHWHRG
jgi:hypothetical protein